ncbi:protein-glutamate methylesterase/protein-glutamine glutaminase [Cellvibrio japonicus]|uniref:Protein-glutamate methylesterase/protein-glutamine glutaminase n=1 Tax=Cellvibrio japonicus (strain Ueda107) TaxID=498211 RepID=B3PCN1_CELJU|nr:chemotaxis response regulator protein-glutamate methylesterase [Cellvibrio japonicus]ACE86223.1 protein-glutamate methylesterase CheB [Cellvibrio japonicus Ueda107]QEI13254.1 chemotaxis response regulator protein-glutamate methylesterase [Cellvibrio japonicus]QEI16828.1 chemotaxis response regulator protein-glutamate methylesterase [Cellvibrio japonicus]QEI20406.1 chemotaxis response regulator protein-glutamate methylesterase [Cellvibrio japonicus]
MTIDVLVIDDSAVVRQVLAVVLNEAPDIHVYAAASDPIFARHHMQKKWPDVIVLDIEMPRMDGLTFLRQLMGERPTPVVICSSLAEKGAELSLQALAAGAVDIVTKPQLGVKDFLMEAKHLLWQTVRAAASAHVHRHARQELPKSRAPQNTDLVSMAMTTDSIVVMGTSTGGTQALEQILSRISRTCPGIAVVQHMPEKFTAAFAKRLDSLCDVDVKEAETGDRLIPGRVLIAPGGHHLEVQRSGAQYVARVFRGPSVNRHCPSVDVLFRSAARSAGRNAMGIIMTGMGDDGARGLLEMRQAGSRTIAQDEASCVVFGMPKEAIQLGAAKEVMPLAQIPAVIEGKA